MDEQRLTIGILSAGQGCIETDAGCSVGHDVQLELVVALGSAPVDGKDREYVGARGQENSAQCDVAFSYLQCSGGELAVEAGAVVIGDLVGCCLIVRDVRHEGELDPGGYDRTGRRRDECDLWRVVVDLQDVVSTRATSQRYAEPQSTHSATSMVALCHENAQLASGRGRPAPPPPWRPLPDPTPTAICGSRAPPC